MCGLSPSNVLSAEEEARRLAERKAAAESTLGTVVSEGTQNAMSQDPSIESYAYFDSRREIGGEECYVFKRIEERFEVEIDSQELVGKIHGTTSGDGTVISVQFVAGTEWHKKRGQWFIEKWMPPKGEPGILPPHVLPRSIGSECQTLPAERSTEHTGRAAGHDAQIHFYGRCVHNATRDPAHRTAPNCDKCNTRWRGGLTYQSLHDFLHADRGGCKIKIFIEFTGNCVHPKDNCKGKILGSIRGELKKQVSTYNRVGLHFLPIIAHIATPSVLKRCVREMPWLGLRSPKFVAFWTAGKLGSRRIFWRNSRAPNDGMRGGANARSCDEFVHFWHSHFSCLLPDPRGPQVPTRGDEAESGRNGHDALCHR